MSDYMDREAGEKLLLSLASVLDSLSLPFFLVQGTALGAYRDGGFTPTERDIDIGVLHERLWPLIPELLGKIWDAGLDTETHVRPLRHPHTVVIWGDENAKADIVGFCRRDDERYCVSPVRPWVREAYAIVHPAEMLESYDRVSVFGREFLVPSPVEQYLEREYGPDWRTPREDHVSRTRVYGYQA